eukprot:5845906-Prymnesium_polylepis.1
MFPSPRQMNCMLGFSARTRSILPAPEISNTSQLSFCYRVSKPGEIARFVHNHVDASYRRQ